MVNETLRNECPTLFSWKYQATFTSLRDLYSKAKLDQWNAERDLDWSISVDPEAENFPDMQIGIYGSDIWDRLTAKERLRLRHEILAWILSNFLHGEQGALLSTAQLVEGVPEIEAKLYGASQVMDEARHVEVFERYLREKVAHPYPINVHLKSLLDTILSDSRWDLKYLGQQIMLEGVAMAAFGLMVHATSEPLLRELLRNVMRDEARHVAFGVLALRDYYRDLPPAERRDRADFVYEAAISMRDRLVGEEVWEKMGLPVAECVAHVRVSPSQLEFHKLLFSRIVPNLKRLGLLEGTLRERFADMGILEYESWQPDA